jgi:hypothetical protein
MTTSDDLELPWEICSETVPFTDGEIGATIAALDVEAAAADAEGPAIRMYLDEIVRRMFERPALGRVALTPIWREVAAGAAEAAGAPELAHELRTRAGDR